MTDLQKVGAVHDEHKFAAVFEAVDILRQQDGTDTVAALLAMLAVSKLDQPVGSLPDWHSDNWRATGHRICEDLEAWKGWPDEDLFDWSLHHLLSEFARLQGYFYGREQAGLKGDEEIYGVSADEYQKYASLSNGAAKTVARTAALLCGYVLTEAGSSAIDSVQFMGRGKTKKVASTAYQALGERRIAGIFGIHESNIQRVPGKNLFIVRRIAQHPVVLGLANSYQTRMQRKGKTAAVNDVMEQLCAATLRDKHGYELNGLPDYGLSKDLVLLNRRTALLEIARYAVKHWDPVDGFGSGDELYDVAQKAIGSKTLKPLQTFDF